MALIGKVTSFAVAGSIVFAGVAWTGGADINTVKDSVSNWKNKIVNLGNSQTALSNKFNEVKANATAKIQEAQARINSKNDYIIWLEAEINKLKQQIQAGNGDLTAFQTEVNRLESELNKANTEVAELKAFVKTAEAETDKVTVLNTDGLDATVQGVTDNKITTLPDYNADGDGNSVITPIVVDYGIFKDYNRFSLYDSLQSLANGVNNGSHIFNFKIYKFVRNGNFIDAVVNVAPEGSESLKLFANDVVYRANNDNDFKNVYGSTSNVRFVFVDGTYAGLSYP